MPGAAASSQDPPWELVVWPHELHLASRYDEPWHPETAQELVDLWNSSMSVVVGKSKGKGTPPAGKGGKGRGKARSKVEQEDKGSGRGQWEAFSQWIDGLHQHRLAVRAQLEQIPVDQRPSGWWAYFIDYDGQ